MPVYEYACTACGERTEARQSFQDPPLEDCPECGGKLRKLYSPVGIVFKGSGFYSTDAKKKSSSSKTEKSDKKTESSSTEKSGKKDSASKSSASTEKKTSTKSTEKSA